MFTLRRYTANGVEMNEIIGDGYTYIKAETNKEDFERAFKEHFGRERTDQSKEDAVDAIVYAFIIHHDGTKVQPLYHGQTAYIMSDTGQTFANVSFK